MFVNREEYPIYDVYMDPVYTHTSTGVKVKAAVPSGASTGIYDALELRDGGSYYLGNGVSKAVGILNSIIAPALIGKDPVQHIAIENSMVHELDGTQNEWGWCKQKLEANVNIDVPLAVWKSGDVVNGIPLYKEFMNLSVGASSFKRSMKMGVEVCHNLKKKYDQDATNIGDGGGFAPNIYENKEDFELLKTSIEKVGYTGMFYWNGCYRF